MLSNLKCSFEFDEISTIRSFLSILSYLSGRRSLIAKAESRSSDPPARTPKIFPAEIAPPSSPPRQDTVIHLRPEEFTGGDDTRWETGVLCGLDGLPASGGECAAPPSSLRELPSTSPWPRDRASSKRRSPSSSIRCPYEPTTDYAGRAITDYFSGAPVR